MFKDLNDSPAQWKDTNHLTCTWKRFDNVLLENTYECVCVCDKRMDDSIDTES